MRVKKTPILLTWIAAIAVGTLAAQKATSTVVIRVMDESGAVVPHATVRVVPAPDPAPRMETDDKGELPLELKPGGYALFVRYPAFSPVTAHFEVRDTKDTQVVNEILHVAHSGGVEVTAPAAKDSLTMLAFPYHIPMAVSLAELKAMRHITVSVHNPHTNAAENYSGVRLADLLAKMNAPLGSEMHGEAVANYVVATGSDGYRAVLSLGEVDPAFHSGEIVVADSMNGKPLDEHSGPFKLVVSEDKRPARAVRNLTTIDLRGLQ